MPPRQELLQGAPPRTLGQSADLPPSGHTCLDPAAGSPLLPAAKGCTHLSARPQPTRSVDPRGLAACAPALSR